jgi:hypothetical protein
MIRKISIAGMIAGLLLSTLVFAQAPAGAPAGATGLCKDGSYWTGATKRGACHGHKGVQTWYATAAAPSGAAATPATTPAASTAAPAPATTAATPAVTRKSTPAPSANAAPGGGPGLVWVNTPSKVYHCSGDRWYGKTKSGSYMSEAAAKAAGARPDHGKACS